MTPHAQEPVNSHRLFRLTAKFREKPYRDSYVSSHVKRFLADQIVTFRGDMSQAEFGTIIGKPQSVVCRLENPKYGAYTLQTLLEIASKLDVALIARFVDFPTFLKFTNDFSNRAVSPVPYKERDAIQENAPPRGALYDFQTAGISPPPGGGSGLMVGVCGAPTGGIAANAYRTR